jgi:aspartate ammonia-lyase
VYASTASVTALVPALGYERACQIAADARTAGIPVREYVICEGVLTPEQYDELISPEAVMRLGMP